MTKPLKKPLYDNIVAQAPDGEPICRCNHQKAEWYLSRDLAELIEPNVIRLKFEPKGRGHAGDEFFLAPKSNACVVCGTDDEHTRHHIVPYCFRRHFPDRLKQHNSYDVVSMCVKDHDAYEVFANELKHTIAVQYGVPFKGCTLKPNRDLFLVKKHATALSEHRDQIPAARVKILEQTLRDHYKADHLTDKHIEEAKQIEPFYKDHDAVSFGEAVVKKIADLDEFIVMWRSHFVDKMKPEHMPKHWNIDRKHS